MGGKRGSSKDAPGQAIREPCKKEKKGCDVDGPKVTVVGCPQFNGWGLGQEETTARGLVKKKGKEKKP